MSDIEEIVDEAIENAKEASEEEIEKFFQRQMEKMEECEDPPEDIRVLGGASDIIRELEEKEKI